MEGVFVANVTPFDAHNRVDVVRLENHLNWLADAGVDGFVPCGTTGEGATLESDERREVIKAAKRVADARKLKVIAGAGSNSTPKVIKMIEEAAQLGCDGALVVTPYYNKPTQAGLVAHYTAVAHASSLPVILYNVPGRTSVSLSPETVKKLFELDRIVAIKEASGNHAQWLALAAQNDLGKKALLAGDDDALATIMAMGGKGIISATGNVAPRALVEIYRAAKKGQWEDAFRIQKRILPLVQAMFLETNPAPAKCALAQMGRMEENLRLPLVPVGSATQEIIQRALRTLEISA